MFQVVMLCLKYNLSKLYYMHNLQLGKFIGTKIIYQC